MRTQTAIAQAFKGKIPQLDIAASESDSAAEDYPYPTEGWVCVLPMTPRDITPRMFGLLVPGQDREERACARLLIGASQSPRWFREQLVHVSTSCSQKQFHVRLLNTHHNGVSAFVVPTAATAFEADQAWEVRQAQLQARPQSVLECRDRREFYTLFYERICSQRGVDAKVPADEVGDRRWWLCKLDVSSGRAWAITRNSRIQQLNGAQAAYSELPKLKSGKLQLKDVIQRYATTSRVYHL